MSNFSILNLVVPLLVALGAFALWLVSHKRLAEKTAGRAMEQVKQLKQNAEHEIEVKTHEIEVKTHEIEVKTKDAMLESKKRAHEIVLEAEQSARERQQELRRSEEILSNRLKSSTQTENELVKRERAVIEREKETISVKAQYDQLIVDQQRELKRVAGLTTDEAKEILLKQIEAEAKRDAANLVKRLENEAREKAASRAQAIVTQAIQRSAADHAIETTVSVADLPNDDLKGRIIGREGRNIRALELATGVELIVDDTPGAVILSSFDPFRREIAKQAIERLIADGRIHPARIEEVVEKVKVEMEEALLKEGETAAVELGLFDLHPEILRLMGRLKFRTSYGQNVLNHSKEVAYLAGIMAKELGLNAHTATRAAFVHDIGKAIDRDMEGTHLELGINLLRKYKENEDVVMAMAAHHMDIDWPSLEAMIVQAADAISSARPGARRDILESYVKRLENLESIADSFKGVSKAFALQAGREIRIMVESENVSDEESIWLSKDIARRIEHELEYPGQIKVTVIRETRSVEFAK